MSQLSPLVFDLDGTLIDSRGDIAAACNHTLKTLGLDPLPTEVIASHVGNGAKKLLEGVLQGRKLSASTSEVLAIFKDYYFSHPTEHNKFMPGALRALELRKERPIALCTNKPMSLTRAVLESLDWTDSFDLIVAPENQDPIKPDPAPLEKTAQSLGVSASSLIMIGDGPQDIGAGKAVGARTIGVKGGFLSLEKLIESGPDHLLETLEELPSVL